MKIIGHRGAKGLAPENTLAALRKGLEHHVDELEFDLRVTKDQVVVLHHNSHLAARNGNRLRLNECTYKELALVKPDLVTFRQVLESIGPVVPLYVEVKPKEHTTPIVKIIKEYLSKGWKPDSFLLGSKSQNTLLELHLALPEIQKIVIEPWSGVRAHYRAKQVNSKRLSMNQRWLCWGFIRGFKNSDYQLYAYTLNDPAKAKRWARYGLSGVITDYPDLYKKG